MAERRRAAAARTPAADATAATRVAPLGGATRVAAVFGDPVEHSLSPAMHNAAYAALGLDRVYAAFHVTPPMLAAALRALPALGIIGVNLTVPHKERALKMVAKLSAEARMLGAINCIANRPAGLYGDNTDARGLERDLNGLGVALKGATAIVIGAGGAAASAVVACLRRGAREVVIANRTPARAAVLARRLRARLPRAFGSVALSAARTRGVGRRGAAGARRDRHQRNADGPDAGALRANRLCAHFSRMLLLRSHLCGRADRFFAAGDCT